MTAIVSLENYNLTDVVEVKKENTEVIPSKIFLKEGEKNTVDSLIDGALIASGNDAANALATAKWTREEFVGLMNRKAAELGMTGTKFYDPAGLDDNGRSTARDIAIMFSYGLNFEKFVQSISTKEKDVMSVDGQIHAVKNSNRLLTGEVVFDGEVIGGKTGVTDLAGHTLVCAARRGDTTVVGVVLGTFNDTNSASAEEMKRLLDWGYASYLI
jgi:D-alanyl-D-alanine carboxypeptidase